MAIYMLFLFRINAVHHCAHFEAGKFEKQLSIPEMSSDIKRHNSSPLYIILCYHNHCLRRFHFPTQLYLEAKSNPFENFNYKNLNIFTACLFFVGNKIHFTSSDKKACNQILNLPSSDTVCTTTFYCCTNDRENSQ